MRGLALIGVVLYHAYRLTQSGEGRAGRAAMAIWERPIAVGRFGVDVFFVLSGFLVVTSWRSLRARHGSMRGAIEYARRRALRILPLYWVSLAVLIPLTAPARLRDGRRLLMLFSVNQYLEPGLAAKVNTPYWSLTTESHFYLLVPVVAVLFRWFGRWALLGGCIALSLYWWEHTPLGLPASYLGGRLDQFVAGAVAAELLREHLAGRTHVLVRLARARFTGAALFAAAAALAMQHGASFGRSRTWMDHAVHPAVGLLVSLWVLRVVTSGRRTVLDVPWVVTLGVISYSVYLWHYPILLHGIRALRGSAVLDAPFGSVVVSAGLIAVAVAIAWVTYHLVERPAMDYANRPARPPRVPGPPVPPVPATT